MSTAPETLLPQGWTAIGEGRYARRLVASEATMTMRNRRFDGHNDVTMGFVFTTPGSDVRAAFKRALLHLRHFAPLVAADIKELPEFDGALSWDYHTPKDAAEAEQWAENTLIVHDPAPEDEDFLVSIAKTRLPYEPLPDRKQYFGCHLLLRPNGRHSFYTHATHTIYDAQPNLYSLRKVFFTAADILAGTPVADPTWGTELAQLPLDLVTALGGLSLAPGQDHGLDLPAELSPDTPSLGLLAQRLTIEEPARLRRVHRVIDVPTSAALLAALKRAQLSTTVLFEAALMLALAQWNHPLPENPQVTLDLTVIALQRYLPPHIPPESYITSCMVFVRLVGLLRDLPKDATPRAQLLALMRTLRAQYDRWLANPLLPLADVLQHPPFPVHRSPYAPFVSNLAVIDRYVPPALPAGAAAPSINIVDYRFGHRIVHFTRPAVHVWSFQGRIHVQIQACDVYDTDYLQAFADAVVDVAMRVLDEE